MEAEQPARPRPYVMMSYAHASTAAYPYFVTPFRKQIELFLVAEMKHAPGDGKGWIRSDREFLPGDTIGDEPGPARPLPEGVIAELVRGAQAVLVLHDRFWQISDWCPREVVEWYESRKASDPRPDSPPPTGVVAALLEPPPISRPVPEPAPAQWLERAHALIAGSLQEPIYNDRDVPWAPERSEASAASAKRIARALAACLRSVPERHESIAGGKATPAAGTPVNVPRVLLCPSSGSAEDARADFLRDLAVATTPVMTMTVSPSVHDLERTFALTLSAIQEADVSVHFFGACPTWKIKGEPLGIPILRAALERAREGKHRVFVWLPIGEEETTIRVRTAVTHECERLPVPPARIKLSVGSRTEVFRRLESFLEADGFAPASMPSLVVADRGVSEDAARAGAPRMGLDVAEVLVTRDGTSAMQLLLERLRRGAAFDAVFLALDAAARPVEPALLAYRRVLDASRFGGRRCAWLVGAPEATRNLNRHGLEVCS